MAIRKGPKMIDELVRKRASGLGLQTIALDLKIARNTVKSRLKEIGAYEIADAQSILLAGKTAPKFSGATGKVKAMLSVSSAILNTCKKLSDIDLLTRITH